MTEPGTGTGASFDAPAAVTVVGGHAYVGTADAIMKVSLEDGASTLLAGTPGAGSCSAQDANAGSQVSICGVRSLTSDGLYLYSVSSAATHSSYETLRRTALDTGATSTLVGMEYLYSVTAAPDGGLYLTVGTNSGGEVLRVDRVSGATSTLAAFDGDSTYGIAADESSVYVVVASWTGNTMEWTIRQVDRDTGAHTVLVTDPDLWTGELLASGGHLYAANWPAGRGSNPTVLARYAVADGKRVHLAGAAEGYVNATGSDAWFGRVTGIASDGTRLYIADMGNHRLRTAVAGTPLPYAQQPAVNTAAPVTSGAVSTLAGSGRPVTEPGTGSGASFNAPAAVTVVGGYAYVGTDDAIMRVALSDGTSTLLAGTPGGGSCSAQDADAGSRASICRVRSLTSDGHYLYSVSSAATHSSYETLRRTRLDTGATSTLVGGAEDLRSVTAAADGNLYVTTGHSGGGQVLRVDRVSGATSRLVTFDAEGAFGIAADTSRLYVVVASRSGYDLGWRIRRVDPGTGAHTALVTDPDLWTGELLAAGDHLYAGTGKISTPYGYDISAYPKATGGRMRVGTIPGGIGQLASDGTHLYATSPGAHLVHKVVHVPPPVPLGQTFGSGNGCDCPDHSVRWGYPVNTATGVESDSFTDLAMAGAGVPFAFVRSYNSADTLGGPLGRGWTHSYHASLAVDGAATVTVRLEDGQRLRYTAQSDGSYTAPPGARATLAATSAGYRLVSPDQGVRLFDGDGRLLERRDRQGRGVTLSYTGAELTGITDDAGRLVTLAYANDRLVGVTLPDGRGVSYGYTDGVLSSVTDARGKATEYGYDAGGRLASVKDPRGNFYFRNTYDETGRVIRQEDARGEITHYGWDPATETATVTAPDGGVWQHAYAGNVLLAETDPLGNTTRYGYDSNRNLISVTDPLGRVSYLDYDARGNVIARTAPEPISTIERWSYDAENNPRTHTDPRGNTTSYDYDGYGRLASTTDPAGAITRYAYTPDGQLANVTDAEGKVTTFGYDADGNRTSSITPSGAHTSYGYDATGRLTSVTDPRGNAEGASPAEFTTTFAYNGNDLLTSVTDPAGNLTGYGYDPVGNRTNVTDAAQRVTSLGYDDANALSTVTEPGGATTTRGYDAAGRLTSLATPAGTTTYGYDLAGRLVSETTARGNAAGATAAEHTWTYGYDRAGNRISVTDPAGRTTSTRYDPLARPVAVTDPAGHTMSTTFDAAGNVTAVTDPLGQATRYRYDERNLLTATVDPRGSADGADRDAYTTRYGYDTLGRMVSRIRPSGGTTTWGYDADGRLVTEVEPRGNAAGADPAAYTTSYGYDPAGNRTSITDPLGNTTRYGYDPRGQLTALTNAKGRTTGHGYDALGRLVAVTAPDGGLTGYAYNTAGDLVTRTDANDHTTHYGYDAAHRLTSVTSPLGQQWSYRYDAEGNRVRMVTARGSATTTAGDHTITATYDALNRLTALDYSDTTPDVTYSYDTAGNRAGMSDGAGPATYGYDAANRLTSVSRGTQGFGYRYDPAGNVTERTYPDGTTVSTDYDTTGRPAQIRTDGALSASYGYDPADRLTTTTLPAGNGHVETRGYDPAGRLVRLTNARGDTILSRFASSYDPAGNPLSVTTTRGTSSSTESYRYDPAERLTGVCYDLDPCTDTAAKRIGYGYDSVGNRTSSDRVGVSDPGSTGYAYNAADQLTATTTTSGGGTTTTASYGYDPDGNQTTDGARRTNSYDLANRLATSTAPNGARLAFGYDGDGTRLTQRGSAPTGVTADPDIDYQWDHNHPLPELTAETAPDGSVLRRYVHGAGPLTMTTGANTFYYHRDPLGSISDLTDAAGAPQLGYSYEPFGAATFYYRRDPLGSIRDLTDAAGAHQLGYAYEPFGAATTTNIAAGAPENRFTFTGELADPSLGQLHLRARQYDPTTGRFTATDPLAPPLTDPYVAAYAYVWNRPGVYTDPTGLFGWPSLQQVSDFSSGFGDTVSFGLTAAARRGLGSDGVVDRSSGSYLGGGITGGVSGAVVGGAGVAAGLARLGVTSRAATLATAASLDGGALAGSDALNAWAAGQPLNPTSIAANAALGVFGGAAGPCLTKLLTRPFTRGAAQGTRPLINRLGAVAAGGERGSVGVGGNHLSAAISRGARTTSSWDEIARRLDQNHRISPEIASARLHELKRANGLGGADNVVFDRTGNVFDPRSGELLGSLTQGGAGGFRR